MKTRTAQQSCQTVYGLWDKSGLRYIGITCRELRDRLKAHMSDRRAGTTKARWIAKLAERGEVPEIRPLQIVAGSHESGFAVEEQWMVWAAYAGASLVNGDRILLQCIAKEASANGEAHIESLETLRAYLARTGGTALAPHPGDWEP